MFKKVGQPEKMLGIVQKKGDKKKKKANKSDDEEEIKVGKKKLQVYEV